MTTYADMTDEPDSTPTGRPESPSRSPRQSVFLNAILERFGSEERTRHRVRDLSAGGMRIDQAAGLQPGATVLVSVGVLEAIGATVVWVRDGWAGIKFASVVDPDHARGKAAVTPSAVAAPQRKPPDAVPTAGWIRDLSSPYRR